VWVLVSSNGSGSWKTIVVSAGGEGRRLRRRSASPDRRSGSAGSVSDATVVVSAARHRRGLVLRKAALVVLAPLTVVLTGALVLAGLGALAHLAGGADGDGVRARLATGPSSTAGLAGQQPSHPTATRILLDRCPASRAATGSRAGARLPNLTLRCLSRGPDVGMRDGRSVPMVVNLWASWCEPCRREMPRLRESSARLDAQAVFLGVDTKDSEADAWQFLAAAGVRYPQVVDPEGRLLAGLRLPGIPATYAVDRSGRIVYRHIGEMHPDDITALEAVLTGTN
jgi:thiol-disulfide isomerase/thioredoxin